MAQDLNAQRLNIRLDRRSLSPQPSGAQWSDQHRAAKKHNGDTTNSIHDFTLGLHLSYLSQLLQKKGRALWFQSCILRNVGKRLSKKERDTSLIIDLLSYVRHPAQFAAGAAQQGSAHAVVSSRAGPESFCGIPIIKMTMEFRFNV